MDFNLTTYYPIFLYLVVIIGFAVSAVAVAHLVAPKKHTPVKQMPYESGMDPIGDARQRVRRQVLSDCHPVPRLRRRIAVPVSLGGNVRPERIDHSRRLPQRRLLGSAGFPVHRRGRLRVRLAERGVPMALELSDSIILTKLDHLANWVPQEQSLADAVRHGLLRHRADGDRRVAPRHRPLRLRGHALLAAPVRSDDRRRPGGHEDDAGPAAHLAADARAEVVHLDGRLRSSAAASSTPMPSCRASIASFRWTSTFRAVRHGRSN